MKFKDIKEYGDLTNIMYNKHINCSKNKLTSLDGRPNIINNDFYCYDNNLKSLIGSPKIVRGHFDCSNNKLTTLFGRPKKISGIFNCNNNPNLKNIKEQIIKYQIEAVMYQTSEGELSFLDIQDEFENYGKFLLKQENMTIEKNNKKTNLKDKNNINLKDLKKLKDDDFGLGI